MYIDLLEAVDPRDAKLLLAIKEKKLHIGGLNDYHVKQAFPDLIPA